MPLSVVLRSTYHLPHSLATCATLDRVRAGSPTGIPDDVLSVLVLSVLLDPFDQRLNRVHTIEIGGFDLRRGNTHVEGIIQGDD